MDRLLTKQEMAVINNAQPSEAKYGDVFEAIAKAQRDLTRAETLKEVGEWLYLSKCPHQSRFPRADCSTCIWMLTEALKRGEIPKE